MTLLRFRLVFACLSLTAALDAQTPPAPVKEVKLIDFTDYRREPNGKVTLRPYEYAWGEWDKHVVQVPDRGTLIQAQTGEGVMGENRPQADFRHASALALFFVIGNANQAQSVNFKLEDGDGTTHVWNIRLARRPQGQPLRLRLHLDKPDQEEAAGKARGLDLGRIAKWEIVGDYQKAKTEVLLIRLTAEK